MNNDTIEEMIEIYPKMGSGGGAEKTLGVVVEAGSEVSQEEEGHNVHLGLWGQDGHGGHLEQKEQAGLLLLGHDGHFV